MRKIAVDSGGVAAFTVQYNGEVGAHLERSTSTAIENREATKITFLIRKSINLTTSRNSKSRLAKCISCLFKEVL